MKKHLSTIVLVVILFVGLGVMLYPVISDAWNAHTQSRAVASYQGAVEAMDTSQRDQMLADAEAYNAKLAADKSIFYNPDALPEYESLLNVSGTGVIGVITIPKVDIELPIYHTTEESVLQIGVGHLQGSSLPVGGESTHAVLSGHRGLPSSKLFTDLDKLEEGDIFMITVLDRLLTYQVDQIRIVLPSEVDDLQIVDGEDLCTLFTCTPYGVNSHRMLVRGHRIENEGPLLNVTAEAQRIEPLVVLPAVGLPLLVLALLVAVWNNHRDRKRRDLLRDVGDTMGLDLRE
ncbi:class C sortase [Xiamenia xianingshaonis]|uniref:Class C sortase n=1 Tax=Xiamenia xianingshaonis TaxID=2682776 RepID=A0A9E6MQP6_9ACTN|nr:class C sortase [Xiamenia xianingshaonis]NGM17954.1 class C sortase [Eggerthellaceae bacterium zg-893]NHM14651.1 class C sortase [Xiamenia xianingshaonis]NHM16333.1 class C sortase [Xiamenia xianingshaonis]QTU84313.1 class C sortase [Xiamenia xianingshaonis]